jgi:hypothetical protein
MSLGRIADRDAYALVARWWRDEETLGIVQSLVTGPDLQGFIREHEEDERGTRFWQAIARVTGQTIEDQVRHGAGRTEWELQAHVIRPDARGAQRLAEDPEVSLDELHPGRIFYEFDV